MAIIVAATFTYGEETVLYPLVAERLLSIGVEGVGYLFAALGAGGELASGIATALSTALGPVSSSLWAPWSPPPLFLLLPLTKISSGRIFRGCRGGKQLHLRRSSCDDLLQRIVRAEVMARGGFAGGVLIVLTLLCPRLTVLDKEAARRRLELAPRIKFLSGLGIFAVMPRASLESLAANLTEESVAPRELVIGQGVSADDFLVVRSDRLEVLSSGETGGAQRKITDLREGDYAGEIGLVERLPRTATVRAMTSCNLYRIKGNDFLSAVNGTPALSGALFAGIAGRLARTHPSYEPRERPTD